MVETKPNTRDRDRDLCCLGQTNTHKQFSFIDSNEYCTAVNVIMHKNIEIGLSNNK